MKHLILSVWKTCIHLKKNWATVLVITAITTLKLVSEEKRSLKARLSLLIVAMVLTRPESILWAPTFISIYFLGRSLSSGPQRAAVLSVPLVLAFGLSNLALTTFRLLYFSYPLPNTYYAKVSPSATYNFSEGLSYLHSFLSSGLLPGLIAVSKMPCKLPWLLWKQARNTSWILICRTFSTESATIA